MGEIFGMIDGRRNLTPKEVTALKSRLRKDVDDRPVLFDACWKEVMRFANQGDIVDYEHLKELYNSIASEKVNNPRSKFYIYG